MSSNSFSITTTGTIRFNLRLDKQLKNGTYPIELIYQIKGSRKYYNTGSKVRLGNWDKDQQKAIYRNAVEMKKLHPELKKHEYSTEREIEALNTSLAVLVKAIKEIEQLHELNKVIYSVDEVIERLKEKTRNKTKKSATSNELSGFLDDYITTYSETRAKGSLSVYSALKRHLEEYQKHFNTSVTFAAINYQFFEDFQAFLGKSSQIDPLIPV